MTMRTTVLLLCFFTGSTALAQATPTDSDAIRASRHASNEALRQHDLKAFAESLDPELVVVTGRGSFVPTRQAYLDLIA